MSEYIGRRIVPTHGGVWDNKKNYEELTIVLNTATGESYIARRPVPAGTAIADQHYWMQYSMWSEQVTVAEQHLMETARKAKEDLDNQMTQVNRSLQEQLRSVNQSLEEQLTDVNLSLEHTQGNIYARTEAAELLSNTNRKTIEERMAAIEQRQEANIGASTEADADYAAEVVDARVDGNGIVYENLGQAMRRNDVFLRTCRKAALNPSNAKLVGEKDNESTATLTRVLYNGKSYAIDLILNYVQYTEHGGHWIRGSFNMPLEVFEAQFKGKRLVYQIYSEADCEVYLAWGYIGFFKEGATESRYTKLRKGYNEILIDTQSEVFQALSVPEDCSMFFFHFLFGDYNKMKQQLSTGIYHFRFSVYTEEQMGECLMAADVVPQAAFAGRAAYTEFTAEAERALLADTALNADHANLTDRAVFAEKAMNAVNSMNAGVNNAFSGMGFRCKNPDIVADDENGIVYFPVSKDLTLATDGGFSINIGTAAELRGKEILLYRDEIKSLAKIALNAGQHWGGKTYLDINTLFKPLSEQILAASFDEMFAALVEAGKTTDDFEGSCYLMIYDDFRWNLSTLEDGVVLNNRYMVFKASPDSMVYSSVMKAQSEAIQKLEETCAQLQKLCNKQAETESALRDEMEALQTGNILWGKKWVACGDSFTEGDFSSYVDAQGLSGKSSPELYDSDWKMYKTYPWWIGKRNHMTIINEAKCGSIMPLDKTYVDDPEHVAITTRNPFSLNRINAIPEDADYITLWFGINDSGHTYLGTISDTTNETFYGAWNVVLKHLIEHFPFAKIGIIVTDRGNAEYRKALREVARKWGIPYLDMMGDDQVPVIMYRETELALDKTAGDLRYNAFKVSSSNGHPNLKAHAYQSTFIEAFLRRL